jgi:hypothetical protein
MKAVSSLSGIGKKLAFIHKRDTRGFVELMYNEGMTTKTSLNLL